MTVANKDLVSHDISPSLLRYTDRLLVMSLLLHYFKVYTRLTTRVSQKYDICSMFFQHVDEEDTQRLNQALRGMAVI